MLFPSKDKKKSNLSKKLTEAEIKRKLYGEYETVSEGSVSASHEVKMSGSAFELDFEKKQKQDTRSAIAAEALGVSPKPVVSSPSSFSRSAQQKKPLKPAVDWKKTFIDSAQLILGFVTGVLFKIGSYLIKGLEFALRLLDPRKPQARKLLYSITAILMVAALFIGVFRLNNQRKQAMMGGRSSVTAATAPAKELPISTPDVAVVTAVSELSETNDVEVSAQKEESQEMILQALESSSANVPVAEPVVESAIGKYVIQVATYAVAEDAKRIVDGLNQAGFQSFYKKQIRNATGHTFYTVCLGRFEAYSSAQETLAKFRKNTAARPFQDAFIRTMEA